MGALLDIAKYRPHLSGDIKCAGCGHKWVGIAPITSKNYLDFLECPECNAMKGVFIHPVLPKFGDIFLRCDCGGDLFSVLPDGALCSRCGVKTTFESLVGD